MRTNKQDHLVCFLPGLLLLGVTEGVRFESDPSSLSYDKAEDWAIGKVQIFSSKTWKRF